MEKLTLQNYSKKVPAALLKKSQKLSARDIDEEQPNHFVAYIDEGENSFDVSVVINEKKEIEETSCDCETNGICIHKVAFFNYLAEKSPKAKELKKPTVRKRKLTETEQLLEDIEVPRLRLWLTDLFKKNKDLNLMFLNEFKPVANTFTPKEIIEIIQTVIKTVIRNKKNIDQQELKKVLELLTSAIKPIMNFIRLNIGNEDTVNCFLHLKNELIHFNQRVYINTKKIDSFMEAVDDQFFGILYELKDYDAWKMSVDELFDFFKPDSKNNIEFIDFVFLCKLMHDNENQKKYVLDKLVKIFTLGKENKFYDAKSISLHFFKILKDNNFLKENINLFQSIRDETNYNIELISELISLKKYAVAKGICNGQIYSNYYPEFDKPYLKKLKEIYEIEGNKTELLRIYSKSVKLSFDFEEMQYIYDNAPIADGLIIYSDFKKNLRKNLNSKSAEIEEFYFKLFESQKDYTAMIDTIQWCGHSNIVLKYLDLLKGYDKQNKLVSVILKFDAENAYADNYYESENIELLFQWLVKNYDLKHLQEFASKTTAYSSKIKKMINEK